MSLFNEIDDGNQQEGTNLVFSDEDYGYFTENDYNERSAAPSPGSYFKHSDSQKTGIVSNSSDKSPLGVTSFKSLVNPFSDFLKNHNTRLDGSSRTITSKQSSLFDLGKIQSSSLPSDHEQQDEKFKNKDYYLLEEPSELYLSTLKSIESKRLANARTQLLVWAYFKSFKLVTLVTTLIFLCIILSLITEISCLPELTSRFPRFEIQTSGSLPYVEGYTLGNIFSMKGVSVYNNTKSEIVSSASKLIRALANDVFGVHFGYDTINKSMKSVFENNRRVIFKIGYLGYCKLIERQSLNQLTCHSIWQSGTDLPSIFIKDITFEMNTLMSNDNADLASDLFINSYHRWIKNGEESVTTDVDEMYSMGVISLHLSEIVTWLRIAHIGLDTMSLALCFVVFFSFKGKASKKSLAKIRDKVNKSLNPFEKSITNKRKYVDILLIAINTLLIISLLFQLTIFIYGVVYLKKVDEILKVKNLQFINGIKLLGLGTTIDLTNCILHLVLIGIVTTLLLTKPWIMKIVI